MTDLLSDVQCFGSVVEFPFTSKVFSKNRIKRLLDTLPLKDAPKWRLQVVEYGTLIDSISRPR